MMPIKPPGTVSNVIRRTDNEKDKLYIALYIVTGVRYT